MNPSPDRKFLLHNTAPVRIEGANTSKVRAYRLCTCVQCSRARGDMQPLGFGDWAWIAAIGLAWLAVLGLAIRVAVQS
jgi:hypothetical protein